MMRIEMKTEVMVEAIRNVSVNTGVDFFLVVASDQKNGEHPCMLGGYSDDDKLLAQKQFLVKAKVEKNTTLFFGKEFGKVVSILCRMGDELVIRQSSEGGIVEFMVGSGKVELPLKEATCDLNAKLSDDAIGVVLKRECFRDIINHGGWYTADDGSLVPKESIALHLSGDPVSELIAYSADLRHRGSYSCTSIVKAGYVNGANKEMKLEEAFFSGSCKVLDFVAQQFTEEYVQLIFSKKVAMLKTNSLFYTVGLYEKVYPVTLENMVKDRKEIAKTVFVKKDVMNAVELISSSFTNSKERESGTLVMNFVDKVCHMSGGASPTEVGVNYELEDGEFTGEYKISLSFIRSMLSKIISEKFTIGIDEKGTIFYFNGEKESNSISYILLKK